MKAKLRIVVGAALAALVCVGCGSGRRDHPKAFDASVMAIPAGLPGSAQTARAMMMPPGMRAMPAMMPGMPGMPGVR